MAYVALGNNTRADIRQQVRTMRETEMRAAGDTPAIQLCGDELFLLDKVWGAYLPLMAQMPRDWMSCKDNIQLQVTYPYTDEAGEEKTVDFSLYAEFSKGLLLPPNTRLYRIPVKHDATSAITQACEQAMKRREIDKRWEKTQAQIETFLNNCKSLNEALKLWPDFRFYVPQHLLDKTELKVVKEKTVSTAAEVLKQIDTDQLVANAVMVRMARQAE